MRAGKSSVAGLALILATCGGAAPVAQGVSDREFVSAADRRCAAVIPPLRPDLADEAHLTDSQVADLVDDRAGRLATLVGDLKTLDVDRADRERVAAWLSDWDRYLDVGRRYSAALRGGDPNVHTSVAQEGNGPLRRISAMARASGMDACALDGVPLPERRSVL